jgi:Protein of unknown function (DUF3467)
MSRTDDKDEVKEEQNAVEKTPKTPQTTIRWDGSKMVSTYANVCNVSGTREEVTLLFGTNQSWHTGQQEVTVELTNRVILNPFAAKRLAILLGNTVREYEAQFGEMNLNVPEGSAD